MEQKTKAVVIGGLLHDIGKLLQRTGNHAGDHSAIAARYLKDERFRIPDRETVLECVGHHHYQDLASAKLAPDSPAWLVYEADNIASGMDRRNLQEVPGFSQMTHLHSVFNLVNGMPDPVKAHGMRPFEAFADIGCPTAEKAAAQATAGEYAALAQVFEKNLLKADLDAEGPDTLLRILEACAIAVPASTHAGGANDISLYDHCRMTAAAAACMGQYFASEGIADFSFLLRDPQRFRTSEAFLLVSGDISGIQDFIYTIASKNALKSLRGRSFYLELMAESLVDDLLAEAGLCRTNLIYSGGGHFYLLMANTPETRKALDGVRSRITAALLEEFSTALYVEIASVPCSAEDLMNPPGVDGRRDNRLGDLFRTLSGKIAAGKTRRYTSDVLGELFEPDSALNAMADDARECAVCRTSAVGLESQEGISEVCPSCRGMVQLGKRIMEAPAEGAVITLTPATGAGEIGLVTAGGRMAVEIATADAVRRQLEKDPAYFRRIYSLNGQMSGLGMSTGVWAGNYGVRTPEGFAADFATLTEACRGIRRLGVLRADVDSLGAVFYSGFRQNGDDPYRFATLTRYAALSRQLSMFFRHHLVTLCARGPGEGQKPFSLKNGREGALPRQLSIVYSGGDDLFIVGAWDSVLELAVDLRRTFCAYTGGRLTFSAGMALFRDGFPVSQMARLTGELEQHAKEMPGKDSVALFGLDATPEGSVTDAENHTYSWNEFLDDVCGEKLAALQKWFGPGSELGLGTAKCYQVLHLLREGRESLNIARLAYLLGRTASRANEDQRVADAHRKASSALMGWAVDPVQRGRLITALNLLIYMNRSADEDKDKEEQQ